MRTWVGIRRRVNTGIHNIGTKPAHSEHLHTCSLVKWLCKTKDHTERRSHICKNRWVSIGCVLIHMYGIVLPPPPSPLIPTPILRIPPHLLAHTSLVKCANLAPIPLSLPPAHLLAWVNRTQAPKSLRTAAVFAARVDATVAAV